MKRSCGRRVSFSAPRGLQFRLHDVKYLPRKKKKSRVLLPLCRAKYRNDLDWTGLDEPPPPPFRRPPPRGGVVPPKCAAKRPQGRSLSLVPPAVDRGETSDGILAEDGDERGRDRGASRRPRFISPVSSSVWLVCFFR